MKIVRPISVLDANLTASNVAETDHAAWDSGTTYGLGDTRIYVVADTHWIVESLQAGNTGHTPTGLDSDTWWLKTGNTNRWKMFDGVIQSQTSAADEIVVTLTSPTARVDSVALFNVDCATARVTVTDATDGVVYDETVSMVSPSGITDWYAYSFEPIVRLRDYVFTELPPYLGAAIEVTLSDAGGTVLCGACVIGLSRNIGSTQVGAQVGIQDYSIKQQDAFGNYSILERAYNKRAVFQIKVENTLIDELQTILAGYRATPVVYVGTDEYASTMIYGYYKDFSTVIEYQDVSILSIELEGLT
jgi:hypothetical protein